MPVATATKSTLAGTKRKSTPVKNGHGKEQKKPKIGSSATFGVKKRPIKAQKPGDDSENSDSDGGAPVDENQDSNSRSDDHAEESMPKSGDGLHHERAKAVAANSQTSRESHAKQKKLVQERKAAKPLADQLARTKKIWERLRRKSHVPTEERKQLVAELFEIITGRIKDFVLKHDSVRVVQTAIKYANRDQKRMIAEELSGTYRQLAESRYAKFLIGKLLIQGDDQIRDAIVPEFFGHIRQLIKHPEASWILDDVYRGVATKQQKSVILREWYGAEFALFQKNDSTIVSGGLSDILAANIEKRATIMRSLHELINQLIQKKMTGFTLLHDAMLQYFLNAKPGSEEITDFLELIKGDEDGDLLKNLAFTRSGSRVVCLALAYGNAKDRKHILKTYKDTLQLMAGDSFGHIIILTAYEVIDDTVLTSKSIFPELLSKDTEKQAENIVLSANDLNARTTLLYLLQGRSKSLFPGSHSADLDILNEIDAIRATTSKKDPEVRRNELVKILSPSLLNAIAAASADLMATSFGCYFVTEILFGASGDKSAALSAIAEVAAGDPTFIQSSDGTGPPSHIASTPYGGKMLKSLVAGGRFDSKAKKIIPVEPALCFSDILYPLIKDHIILWATGSSSFVVLALLESKEFTKTGQLLKSLKENKTRLQEAATQETAEQKVKRENAEAEDNNTNKKLKSSEPGVGNKGSSLLLEMCKD